MIEATERPLASGAPYAELTIEQIASEAGQSPRSFYFLFRDKRELLVAVAGDLAEFVAGATERWLADPEADRAQLETRCASLSGASSSTATCSARSSRPRPTTRR